MIDLKIININKFINYLLVGYAFCLPISKAGVNFFEISILILWLIQGDWKYKLAQYKQSPLIIALSAFLFLNIISLLWASSISYGFEYIAKYRHFLIIFVVYTVLNRNLVKYIFSAFLLGMFISEVISYGIFFELFTYKNISHTDPSPFMSHTDYSIYLAFTSIVLLFRIMDDFETLKYKIIYSLFFLSVTGNLFINGGRTGQVTFIVLIIVTFFISIKSKLKALIISIILLSLIFLTAYNTSPNFNNRANQAKVDIENMLLENDYRGSFSTRVSLWIVGYEQFKDNFLIGTGIGNEMNDLDIYIKELSFNAEHLIGFTDHHNTFIIIALQLGVLGFLLILLIFYFLLILKFKSIKYKVYNLTFIIGFVMWSFGGHTMHLMNSMIFLVFSQLYLIDYLI